MLVLSRLNGESIRIGKDIVVHLVETRGKGRALIGITAPNDMKVLRSELTDSPPLAPTPSPKRIEQQERRHAKT